MSCLACAGLSPPAGSDLPGRKLRDFEAYPLFSWDDREEKQAGCAPEPEVVDGETGHLVFRPVQRKVAAP